jgi:hypothetical protein
MDRNKRILDEIQRQSYVQVQNALMRMNDLDLALALYYMADRDRALVLSYIGEGKARRVQLQLDRLAHVKVSDGQFDSAVNLLMSKLSGVGRIDSSRKYYRPGASSRRNPKGQ